MVLNQLKAFHLKGICRQIGASEFIEIKKEEANEKELTGTKAVQISNIMQQAQLLTKKPVTENNRNRILSIDMGIKNLAFAVLEPDRISGSKHTAMVLRAWEKHDLGINDYSVSNMATVAIDTVLSLCQAYKPGMVVVEQQRYRTQSNARIPEWTVRVNSLEAMFHALFGLLSRQRCLFNGTVMSVTPASIKAFYFPSMAANLSNSTNIKAKKIELVQDLLTSSSFHSNNVMSCATKKDDLADCLLQAIAIAEWTRNSHALLTALPETDSLSQLLLSWNIPSANCHPAHSSLLVVPPSHDTSANLSPFLETAVA